MMPSTTAILFFNELKAAIFCGPLHNPQGGQAKADGEEIWI